MYLPIHVSTDTEAGGFNLLFKKGELDMSAVASEFVTLHVCLVKIIAKQIYDHQ